MMQLHQSIQGLDDAEALAASSCLSPKVRAEFRMDPGMFFSAQGMAVAIDIWNGHAKWNDACAASMDAWTHVLQLRAITSPDQRVENGIKVVRNRYAKGQKLSELSALSRRLSDPLDPCTDVIGSTENVNILGPKEIAKIVHERYTKTPTYQAPWPSISGMLAYWGPGDVYLLTGLSSVGKTAFAFELTKHLRTLYFGVDMTVAAAGKRHFEIHFYENVKNPELYGIHNLMRQCAAAFHAVKQSPEEIERYIPKNFRTIDSSTISLEQIEWTTKDAIRSGFIPEAVVIDYVGRITTEKSFNDQWREDKLIAQQLKPLARRCNVPVLALAQFNAKAEPWKRPQPSWLSGSKELMPTVDGIISLWRDKTTSPSGQDCDDRSHIWVSDDMKGRDTGSIGDVRLECRGVHFFEDQQPHAQGEGEW